MFGLDLIGQKLQTAWHNQLQQGVYDLAYAHTELQKYAAAPENVKALVGTLYLSASGWVLLSVPNALGRGAFDALGEPGAELPTQSNGNYAAHITVFRPEEVAKLGGPSKITERGHQFRYSLGPIQTVRPAGWAEMERVWYILVSSPELERLRRSYGLSGRPNQDKHRFHITIGVRRRNVLGRNEVQKGT